MPLKTAQPEYVQPKYVVSTQHNQFTAGLSRFGPAGTPSRVSYHQGVAQNNHEPAFLLVGNPLMNDAQLSQTADRAKTRQPGLW
jgi:hypothetical protein